MALGRVEESRDDDVKVGWEEVGVEGGISVVFSPISMSIPYWGWELGDDKRLI